MKNFLFVLLAAVLLAASCKKDPAQNGCQDVVFQFPRDTFDLCQGHIAALAGNGGASIRFDAVTADSRCPIDALCVWAGRADVKLRLQQNGATESRTVSLGDLSGPGVSDQASFGNLNVQIIAVQPDALSGQPIEQEEYKIKLVVWKTL